MVLKKRQLLFVRQAGKIALGLFVQIAIKTAQLFFVQLYTLYEVSPSQIKYFQTFPSYMYTKYYFYCLFIYKFCKNASWSWFKSGLNYETLPTELPTFAFIYTSFHNEQ